MVPQPTTSVWRQLGWMALIWFLSVNALGIVAVMIRWWLHP